jgi:hypothetical protein
MSCSSELNWKCGSYDCQATSAQSELNQLADYIFYDQVPCLEPATVSFTLKNCYSLDPVIEFVEECPLFVGRGRDEMVEVLEDLNELAESLYLYHYDVLDIYHMERNILRVHIVRPADRQRGCEKSSNQCRRNSDASCESDQADAEEWSEGDSGDDEVDEKEKETDRDTDREADKDCKAQDEQNRVIDSPGKSASPAETSPKDGEKSEEKRDTKVFHRISLDLKDYRRCYERSNQNGYSSDAKYALAMVTAFVAALVIPTLTLTLRSANC